MSIQRDELAAAIAAADKEIESYGAVTTGTEPRYQELLYGPTSDMPERVALKVLEAVKPRTITTVEELDALPVGSVVLCRGRAWSRYVPRQALGGLIETHKWMCADGGFVRAESITDVILPATVLFEPTA